MFDSKVIVPLSLLSQVGISMLVPIFLMVGLGSWVDQHFSTQLFPLFILLGIGAGFRNTYFLIMKAAGRKKEEKQGDEETEQ